MIEDELRSVMTAHDDGRTEPRTDSRRSCAATAGCRVLPPPSS